MYFQEILDHTPVNTNLRNVFAADSARKAQLTLHSCQGWTYILIEDAY